MKVKVQMTEVQTIIYTTEVEMTIAQHERYLKGELTLEEEYDLQCACDDVDGVHETTEQRISDITPII